MISESETCQFWVSEKKTKEPTSSGHFKNLKKPTFHEKNQYHLVVVWLVK
jgi:hypothetical protein